MRSCLILVSIAILSGIGCSSAPEKISCSQSDWYEIGRLDGAQGRGIDALEKHRNNCGASFGDDNETVYTNGRNAGLVEYCSLENAYEMGRMATAYSYVCPTTVEAAFLGQYEKGKVARELETQNEKLDARMYSIRQQMTSRLPAGERLQLLTELKQIRKEREANQRKLAQVTKETPTSKSE